MNDKNVDQLLSYYADNAVLVCPKGALQGKAAIRDWLESVTKDFSKGNFTLVDHARHSSGYNFKWQAANGKGLQMEGRDSIGILDREINYHYSFVRQTETQS